ncbi:RNA polymerase III RPC4-domain-containing protein [Collybia nuda]|uniref:RNA polymerase III RPC4-domain-containing protein n=1 Tax=Collybia nuda TaxID=64659 RepID=A0A9P5XVM4_9AGAR|nr:RNA polymerase III RPC4-domain-containing protein [Collybia nuda]
MLLDSSDVPSGSGSTLPSTKAISSLAKKQGDVTRQGTQKLKFVPTLPARRKKEEIKTEPVAQSLSDPLNANRGRGRGRGEARGRGRGRGAPRPDIEMTASGPFAMGPALAGNNARRSAPRSNFAPTLPPSGSTTLSSTLTYAVAPSLRQDIGKNGKSKEAGKLEEEEEVYSDPDEGVEIVDMGDVRKMDWMAPESLSREHHIKKPKKEEPSSDTATGDTNHANALDLSESEEEEELEDIIEHFANQSEVNEDSSLREERLYFFQFPSPFPMFLSPTSPDPTVPVDETAPVEVPPKKVAFAKDAKSEPGTAQKADGVKEEELLKVDGIIGQLETYRSGAVKMRLANGILLDVTAATQPSFLQHAVCLNIAGKRLSVLGEVNKRFSVSPNVEALLAAMDEADRLPTTLLDSKALIQIDMS